VKTIKREEGELGGGVRRGRIDGGSIHRSSVGPKEGRGVREASSQIQSAGVQWGKTSDAQNWTCWCGKRFMTKEKENKRKGN